MIIKFKFVNVLLLQLDKQVNFNQNSDAKYSAEEGFGFCGHFLIGLSYFMLIIGLPFTLCCCMKVVQEYQRAVIFRLGRILSGGAKGSILLNINIKTYLH